MSIADQLGFGPTRIATKQSDGTWLVKVTPPELGGDDPDTDELE